MRTFTLPEAQTLLPVLGSLLERAQQAAGTAAARENTLQSLHQAIFLTGGMHVDLLQVARIKGEQERAVADARDTLKEIDEIGVSVKDLQTGLPSIAAGVGIVYAHPVARFELNFSLPLVLRKGEEGRKGLQLGIGINFL